MPGITATGAADASAGAHDGRSDGLGAADGLKAGLAGGGGRGLAAGAGSRYSAGAQPSTPSFLTSHQPLPSLSSSSTTSPLASGSSPASLVTKSYRAR